jgi:hypothetical protein
MASLKTILAPGVPLEVRKFDKDILHFCRAFGLTRGSLQKELTGSPIKTMLYRSAPTVAGLAKDMSTWKYSSSWLGLQQAAVSLYASPVWEYYCDLYSLWSQRGARSDSSANLVACIEELALSATSTLEAEILHQTGFLPGPVGRLGFKQEAAGKVRVFAMVDCWTQWLLQPLHLALFRILDTFPADGTHDQLAPIHRLIEKGFTSF